MDEVTVEVAGCGSVIIKNENTTIGYATFDTEEGYLSYIFVNPAFRRRGYGSILLDAAQKKPAGSCWPHLRYLRSAKSFSAWSPDAIALTQIRNIAFAREASSKLPPPTLLRRSFLV